MSITRNARHRFPPIPLLPVAVGLMVGVILEHFCFGASVVSQEHFGAGVTSREHFGSGAGAALVSPVGAFLTFLVLAVIAFVLRGRAKAQSATLILSVVALGVLLSAMQRQRLVGQVLPAEGRSATVEAVVMGEPSERPRTIAVDLLLPTVEGRPTLRCYVWKDERSRALQLGQGLRVVIANGRFVGFRDWQPYAASTNLLTGVERLRLRALHWRHGLLMRLRDLGASDEQYSVLAAMTLGDKSGLTADVRHTFSQTGSSHILALSGLHLGIICLLLTRLMPCGRRWWIGQVLVVLALWAFALLTGLSTSVVRSATMLSLYVIFSAGARRRAPLNVLCFTAIVMLMVSPGVLFDVGFQLSFLSVAAILLFFPVADQYVSQRWLLQHPLARWLWSMTVVSTAAQLGTAPLVAYYFHQLPVWFLLTNLFVVPLTTLILYLTLATLLVPAVGGALLWAVGLLTSGLAVLSRLPLSSIDGLHPSWLQTVMWYVVIAVAWLLAVTCSPASARYR
ncbi:MAG: ComEC/Rec2 family competence protein [Prevotella sp.]|nr:ComEC/Rec2 family competence protein [Prevotella sp.]